MAAPPVDASRRLPSACRAKRASVPRVSAIPEGLHTITPHIVVGDAAEAAEWYARALGAVERSRVPLPGGRVMTLELRFGDSSVMVASEFPDLFWGDRHGQIADPFGHRWNLARHARDVPPEEIARAAAEAFGG